MTTKHFIILIIIFALYAFSLPLLLHGQTAIAPGSEIQVSIDSVTSEQPELAISNDGVVWVLWGNAGRWINPNLTFDGFPMSNAGNHDTQPLGSYPVSLPDMKWMKIDLKHDYWSTGQWPFGVYHQDIRYFYRTYTPRPDQSLPSLVVNETIDDRDHLSTNVYSVTTIKTQNCFDKVIVLTARFLVDGIPGYFLSDFRFKTVNKNTLQINAPYSMQLWYDWPYVLYKQSGSYYLHDIYFSPLSYNGFASMQRQKIRVDSAQWFVDRYRRNIGRFDTSIQMNTPWMTLDTLPLACVDQSYQLLLEDTGKVWICGRDINGSSLYAEEWSFSGLKGRRVLLANNVKYKAMNTEYKIFPRSRGGYILVWAGVEVDSSTDVYLALLDDSMNKISFPYRINNERTGNQYCPAIDIKDDTLYTVWLDERDGTRQVYFKRTPLNLVTDVNITLSQPQLFTLEQNYPNPFGASSSSNVNATTISFTLAEKNHIRLNVYDMFMRDIVTLIDEERDAGSYSVTFHAKNLPSGTYFYKLATESNSRICKMNIIN